MRFAITLVVGIGAAILMVALPREQAGVVPGLVVVAFAIWVIFGSYFDAANPGMGWAALPDGPDDPNPLSDRATHARAVYGSGFADAGFHRLGLAAHDHASGRQVFECWASRELGFFADIAARDGMVRLASYFNDGLGEVITADLPFGSTGMFVPRGRRRWPGGGQRSGYWWMNRAPPAEGRPDAVADLIHAHQERVRDFLRDPDGHWEPWQDYTLEGRLAAARAFEKGSTGQAVAQVQTRQNLGFVMLFVLLAALRFLRLIG
jgi:hypothetical protein